MGKIKEIHGDKYDFSDSVYTNRSSKVTFKCYEHGEISMIADALLVGKGCMQCGYVAARVATKINKKEFIENAAEIHGDKFNYSLVPEKIFLTENIPVVCPIHGEITTTARRHLKKYGCIRCAKDGEGFKKRLSKEDFIRKSKKIHEDLYDYLEVEYQTSKHKVKIFCRKHEKYFMQSAADHMAGKGCPLCKWDKIIAANTITTEEFLERMVELYKETYTYKNTVYAGYQEPIIITCRTHGDFIATPDNLLHGHGCSRCARTESQVEDRIADELEKYTKVIRRDRSILGRRELDIILPDKNIAIEYNGAIWHSERFHKNPRYHMVDKTNDCLSKGIRLINVMDYENEQIIIKTIKYICGFGVEKVYARQCLVSKESMCTVKWFVDNNHLQGCVRGGLYYTLRYKEDIVAVMIFSRVASERGSREKDRYELRRFCSSIKVIGGASKLLTAFLRDTPQCRCVISYSDNKWFTGDMYEKLGFKFIKNVPQDYKYIDGNSKIVKHKNNFKRTALAKLNGFAFDGTESEIKNCHKNNWWRVWDCGKKKWLLEV
jgi:hypothetical protein